MSAILQPPRAFQFAIILQVPEDPRTDEELTLSFLQSVSLSAAMTTLPMTINVTRVAPTPRN